MLLKLINGMLSSRPKSGILERPLSSPAGVRQFGLLSKFHLKRHSNSLIVVAIWHFYSVMELVLFPWFITVAMRQSTSLFFYTFSIWWKLNMELNLQSLFGFHVHSFTHCLKHRNPPAVGLINEGAIGQPR